MKPIQKACAKELASAQKKLEDALAFHRAPVAQLQSLQCIAVECENPTCDSAVYVNATPVARDGGVFLTPKVEGPYYCKKPQCVNKRRDHVAALKNLSKLRREVAYGVFCSHPARASILLS